MSIVIKMVDLDLSSYVQYIANGEITTKTSMYEYVLKNGGESLDKLKFMLDDLKGMSFNKAESNNVTKFIECIDFEIKRLEPKTKKANTTFQIPTDLLDKLEQGGFIQKEPLQWLKSKSLLAYFVDMANDKLNLKHGQKRSIKPFEDMFDVSGLTGCMNEYKNKTGQPPQGYEDVNKLFE